jgi:hypothetical protein
MLVFAELRALEALSEEQLQIQLALTDNVLLELRNADEAFAKYLEAFLSLNPQFDRFSNASELPPAFIQFFLSEFLDTMRRDDRKKIHQY